jgi:hypothetical protein
MELPTELQRCLAEALAEMRADPAHQLRPYRRQVIYEALGPPDDPATNRTRGWLGVVIARFVLPVWETIATDLAIELRSRYGYDDQGIQWLDLSAPARALAIIEDLVKGRQLDAESRVFLHERFYYWQNIGLQKWFPDKAWWPVSAIYWAQPDKTGYFGGGEDWDTPSFSADDSDEDRYLSPVDLAGLGVRAYASIYDSTRDRAHEFRLDAQRSQEFWEWWLQEAVPRAWALAHQPLP